MNYINDINQLDLNKTYSYADYLLWKFKERVELIKGKIFKMSPAPKEQHQKISFNLTRQLANASGQPCSIYYAPFDVRLPRKRKSVDKEIESVVQPDIVVICDQSKIDSRGCIGAPDVIFEILSESTLQKDLREKYDLYESSGVREYWIVDPAALTIQINVLGPNGTYIPGRLLTRGSIAVSSVVTNIEIDLDMIFPPIVEEPEEEYVRI